MTKQNVQSKARSAPMDLFTWPTTSNPSLPPTHQTSYDHHQPVSIPIPLTNPNPNQFQLISETYAYYSQHHQIQSQTQFYHHPQQPTAAVRACYYQDPNWLSYCSQSNALHNPPNLSGVAVPSNWVQQYTYTTGVPNATSPLPNQAIQLHGISNGTKKKKMKKKVPKKAKVVQSASCDICKIVCTSQEVLEQHKLGKKHSKNVSKTVNLDIPLAVTSNPVIGPAESLAKTKTGASRKSKRPALSQVDLESKRMKVVAEGASAAAVRVCTACNVVCNSDTVFNYHIAGQKHASSMKKYLASAAGKIIDS